MKFTILFMFVMKGGNGLEQIEFQTITIFSNIEPTGPMGYNGPQRQMKKTLLLALAMFFATVSFAQQQLATLNHNDSITVFYGIDALISAHNAAVNGDIITLSSGLFNTPTYITKAITIRGAGAWVINGNDNTVLYGSLDIAVPYDSIHHLTLEGLFSTNGISYRQVYNPQFIKCYFESFYCSGTEGMYNATFINCILKSWSSANWNGEIHVQETQFINSVILNSRERNPYTGNYFNGPAYFINCILHQDPQTSFMSNRVFTNCILFYDYNSSVTPSYNSNSAYNCIFVQTNTSSSYTSNLFSGQSGHTLWNKRGMNTVFQSFDGTYNGINFALLDGIATTCLGTDSTQVGIYGGVYPFNPRVTNPAITHINVGQRSTPDGKLAVDIEVVSEDE